MKLIFSIQIGMKVVYRLRLWFLMGMDKHSKSSKNSKFTISLQYLKKEFRDEIGFLHGDKYQSFLQSWFQLFGHQSFQQGVVLS